MGQDHSPGRAEREVPQTSWPMWASVIIGGFVLASLILGLVVLPLREQDGFDPFGAICRSIGIPGYEKPEPRTLTAASAPVSNVTWSAETRRLLAGASTTRGASLGHETCAVCHGETGISVYPQQFPNLAAQSEAAIFKQLRDFQTGARKSEIMAPTAQPLTQQQMADVAAYYAGQPPPHAVLAQSGVPLEISTLARRGDPSRAIASCESCHGPSRSGPEEAPMLLGQSAPYLAQQLMNFASAARGNDVFERMRTIATLLTPDEIDHLAVYYSGLPVPEPSR
jgi:cytochrome c553